MRIEARTPSGHKAWLSSRWSQMPAPASLQEEARLNVAFGLKAAAVHRVEVPGLAGGPQVGKRLWPAHGNASPGVH